jgi:hypothetical protein
MNNTFQLGELPDAVISNLLAVAPLKDSGQWSLVNKKFAQAFMSNVTWQCRCERDLNLKV